MCKLRSYDDNVEMIQQMEDNCWIVVYEDGNVVEVQYDEADSEVVLSTMVEDMSDVSNDEEDHADPDREEFLALLLTFNYLCESSGGVRMALDGPNGNIVMLVDLKGQDIPVDVWSGILRRFVEMAHAWQDAFADEDLARSFSEDAASAMPAM